MYKIQTKLMNFNYGSFDCKETLLVTWFKLDKSDQGICFSKDELFRFSRFIKSHQYNFEDPIYLDCSELSANFNYKRIILDTSIHIPKLLAIRKTPMVYKMGEIFECMDIILTGKDSGENHDYNLNFAVLGHVEY
jgi:hypothetical protein